MAYYSGVVFYPGAAACLANHIFQVKIAVMTALYLLQWAFYGIGNDFGLDLRLMTHESDFVILQSAVVADIDEHGLPRTVRRTQSDAATFSIAFERLRYLDRSSMGLSSAVRWLLYLHADGSVLNGVSCPRRELICRSRLLMSWSQASRAATEFFRIVDGACIPFFLTNISQ